MAEPKLDKQTLFNLTNEIRMSEKFNEQELEPQMRDAIKRYTSTHIPEIAFDWTIVLNEIYPVIQFNLPSIFFRNPRVFLKPKNKFFIAKKRNPISGQMEEVQLDSTKSARTQEAILNYTMSEIRYKQEIRRVLLDALLFRYAILWHGYKGNFGMTEEKSIFVKDDMVFVQRVNPLHFLKDPSVSISNLDEARWVGRSFDIPLQDLLEDDTLDIDRKQIKGQVGFGNVVGTKDAESAMKAGGADFLKQSNPQRELIDFTDKNFKESMGSKFVRCYEIFLRPTKKQKRDGEKGKIILLTKEQDRPLRVNDWPYKAEGFPAKLLQFNEVPDHMIGLSDIEVYGTIADHKNLVVNQQIRNAENLNKVWVGISKEGAEEEDVEKARSGENTIVRFESGDVRQRMFVASGAGGASQELYLLDGRIEKNLQDKSGVSDLKRGFMQSGEESAASVKLRAAGGSARPAYRQDIMSDFLKDSTHYLNQLLKQFMPFEDAVRIMGTTDIEWSEKPTKEEIQADTDVEIDVFSMLPENPQEELQSLITVLNLMTQSMSNPMTIKKLESEGKMFNLTPVIDNILQRLRLRDPEIFRGIRPEESQGMASISELRAAQANVQAVFGQQELPSPPAPGQDHKTRIEVMSNIAQVMQAVGQADVAQALLAIIEQQSMLLQEEQERENPRAGNTVSGLGKGFGTRDAAMGSRAQSVGV
jgi:hypothetical protein